MNSTIVQRGTGLGVVVLLASAVGGCASAGRGFESKHPDVAREIRAANEELSRRLEQGDQLGVAAMYADDGILLSHSGNHTQGRADIDAYWQRFQGVDEWRLEVIKLEGSDKLVTQRGRSTIVWADRAHNPSVVEFVLVWVKGEDGAWKAAVDAYWRGE